ncbi:MAG: hypothetical protein ABSE15_01905 [Candidatus Bathyarchaeia archaeon]
MRRNPGFAIQVERRICRLQQTVRVDTQGLRNKWISELDDLFDMATSIAKGKVSQQQVGDRLQSITPKERQMWAQVSANIGLVMGNLAKGYDETQVDEDLAELERLMDEIKKVRANVAEKRGSAEARLTSKDDSTGN